MIVLIHDLSEKEGKQLVLSYDQPPTVVADDGTIKHCVGCFGCWTKDPGVCILKDKYNKNGALLGHASEVHIFSRCYYGGFSPFIKNVLDRSISYVHPDLRIREGKTHHRLRYEQPFKMKIWFYGDCITKEEKSTAQKLARANIINMGCILESVEFVEHPEKVVGRSV